VVQSLSSFGVRHAKHVFPRLSEIVTRAAPFKLPFQGGDGFPSLQLFSSHGIDSAVVLYFEVMTGTAVFADLEDLQSVRITLSRLILVDN
jgi:hypothetical protein